MSEHQIAMTEARFHDAIREAQAYGWDAAVNSMTYPDGTKVELMSNVNPYRTTK